MSKVGDPLPPAVSLSMLDISSSLGGSRSHGSNSGLPRWDSPPPLQPISLLPLVFVGTCPKARLVSLGMLYSPSVLFDVHNHPLGQTLSLHRLWFLAWPLAPLLGNKLLKHPLCLLLTDHRLTALVISITVGPPMAPSATI